MKTVVTILFTFQSIVSFSQSCTFSTGKIIEHGNLKQTILHGNDALNQLQIKTGIGPDGSMDSRTYAPLIYSSNFWMSGKDPSGNIKLAAGMYNIQDWSPGPLDMNGQVNQDKCEYWDQIFTYTKEDILKARDIIEAGLPCENIPESILQWPAKGNPFIEEVTIESNLAEFHDENFDGIYNPCDGDIPAISFRSCDSNNYTDIYHHSPCIVSYYIMNDNGMQHLLTNASALQMEVGVYTFSVKASSANNIIFNKYVFTNKSNDNLKDAQIGEWFDFDLGCPQDDYIGSDEDSKMLFAYNASETDDCQGESLEPNLPMIGMKALSKLTTGYIIDYDEDGNIILVDPGSSYWKIDTLVDVGVSSIIIPEDCQNSMSQTNCNPMEEVDFHNSMNALYFNNEEILDRNGVPTKFMFQGNPADINSLALCNDTSSTIETTALINVGPFASNPYQRDELITATFVTQDAQYPCPDLTPLKYKSEIAQELIDNCFFNHLTPPAPIIKATNMNSQIALSLISIPTQYTEIVSNDYFLYQGNYEFEGVKIYQVASQNFDLSELENPTVSQLVYQGDIQNGITSIANYKASFDGADIEYIPIIKTEGEDKGIETNIILTKDYLTDTPIEPGVEYFYVAISYAHNNYMDFNPETMEGQQFPYLETNCGIKVISSESTLTTHNTNNNTLTYIFSFNNNNLNLSNISTDLNLTVYTIDGKRISNTKISKTSTYNSTTLFDKIPSGLYFINIHDENNISSNTHKVFVTH